MRDPEPRSRTVFTFHQPKELLRLLQEGNSLRERLTHLPPLNIQGLRECQVKAIKNLEQSFSGRFLQRQKKVCLFSPVVLSFDPLSAATTIAIGA